MPMTQRIKDTNGWYEVKKNPLSLAGVFPYRGSSLDAPDPNKMYNVYRPASELSNPDTIESFKLLPLVDDHHMLGSEADGLTPAEKKIPHGVIGENVTFDGKTLYGNIKIFSEKLKKKIDSGKKQLSAGYRCVYKSESGVHDGKAYDYVQTNIRGNHLALVDEGRMGPKVSVQDHDDHIEYFNLAMDSKELELMTTKSTDKKDSSTAMDANEFQNKVLASLDAMNERFTKLETAVDEADKKAAKKKADPDEDAEGEAEDDKSEDKKAADKKASDKKMKDDEAEDKKTAKAKDAADAAEMKSLKDQVAALTKGGSKAFLVEAAKRDALASKLSPFIGSFDHKEKTLDEVAKYGVEKLGLDATDGQEETAINAYLKGRVVPHSSKVVSIGQDGKATGVSSSINDLISGKKAS